MQRQYVDKPPSTLSNALRRAILYLSDLHGLQLRREVSLGPACRRPLLVASDAQLDAKRSASIATLVVDVENSAKWAVVAEMPASLRQR